MAVRKAIARTSSNYTMIEGVSFYNADYSKGSGNWPTSVLNSHVRAAAKRFVKTADFDRNAMYYDAYRINGKWHFDKMATRLVKE